VGVRPGHRTTVRARHYLSALLALALLGPFARSGLHGADAPPLTLAVFDFEARDVGAGDAGRNVAALLNASLSAEASLVTVERAELDKILGEQALSLSGTVSTESAVKVGNLVGAKILVTGRIFKVDADTILVAKIISAETSRVYGEMVKGRESTADLAGGLARKIVKTVTDKGDTLVAKTLSREQRVELLKTSLKEARRPAVYVKIPERHYGTPAVDPAAETELMKLLLETGFTIAESEAKAEVLVSGEAFSAAAGRKGNLMICKARVEVKATLLKTGAVLSADRETSAAVDLAEQTAGKTALQQAADALASRLLPKLVQ
jgi:hypothetical protein